MLSGLGYLKNILIVGDRVLIKPNEEKGQSSGGLYLPPGIKEKEEVQTGRIVKVGPGYPIPVQQDFDEYLNDHNREKVRYVPLQAQEGDIALYLKKQAYEIEYEKEKYVIVNHNSVLMIIREEIPGLDF